MELHNFVMPARRALISVITLFGGHFLNRRLDRVVMVGALLVVAAVASMSVQYAQFLSGPPDYTFIAWALRLPLAIFGALALLSAGLTFRDAQHPVEAPLNTAMRFSGVALSLAGVLLMAAVLVVSSMRYMPAGGAEASPEAVGPAVSYRPFHAHVIFGGGASNWDLPAPPSGPERLRGRIMLEGAGAEGVELTLALNGKYRVEQLISDSRGMFEVQLPAGTWRINSITANEWDGRPMDRDLVLLSGHELTKGAGQYRRNNFHMNDGLEVLLPVQSNEIPVELELRDALAMSWPPRSDSFGASARNANVPQADFSTAVIAWQPVEAASEYEVQIAHVTRKGTTTTFSHILMRRLAGLELPLATLPERAVSNAPADEYSVHVYAFDAAGKLLTESSMDLDDRMFKLAGETRLGEEQQSSFGRSLPEMISADYEINDLRLSLAAKLLDEKQFDEARRVLDQVTKDAPPGRALALRGRLAALQGDCRTATQLFDRADAEGGTGCAPIEYRKLCAESS